MYGIDCVCMFVFFKFSVYCQSTRSQMEKSRSEKVIEVISLSSSFFDVSSVLELVSSSDLTFCPYVKSVLNLERVEFGPFALTCRIW